MFAVPSFFYTFAMMNTPALALEKLTTGYRSGKTLHPVGQRLTGEISAGEMTALVGRNGCGKSTLLRTLAGFLPPISGSVRWLGRELTEIQPRELSRLLSIVLTDRPDTGFLTVREIVETGRMPYTNLTGRLTAEDREVADRALYLTDTADFARRRLTSLSDGERQRVMIAKALAQQTPVILLDEPTAFLDYPGKIEMLELLTRLAHEEHKTILISTHDLELTFQTADRLWLLGREGIQQGATREMLESGVLEKELKYAPRVVAAASADQ